MDDIDAIVTPRIDDPTAVCTVDAKHALVSDQRPSRTAPKK